MKKAMLTAALSASALAAAGGVLTTAADTAAASSVDIPPVPYYSQSGVERGFGEFAADPAGPYPGDAIAACDTLADGWGIEVQLDVNPGSSWHTDRSASTGGHPSGYCTTWHSKNIKEETRVAIRVCKVKAHHHTACGKRHYGRA